MSVIGTMPTFYNMHILAGYDENRRFSNFPYKVPAARPQGKQVLPHWQEYSAEILPHANAVVRSEGFRFHVVTHGQNYHFELNSALPHPATDISQLGWPRSFAVSV